MSKADIVKFYPVKDYIKEAKGLRSNKGAVNSFINRFNSLIESTIDQAAKLARDNRRKTILQKDMREALEKTVGKKHLDWQEILEELLLQTPADLGKISKGIVKYVEQHEKKK